MEKETLYKILGVLAIVFVIVLTLTVIKFLPAIIKVLALLANVVTIYFALKFIKTKKR